MVRRCSICLYTGQCVTRGKCPHFTPLVEPDDDGWLDHYIEEERQIFFERWLRQLEEEDRLQDYFG